MSENLDQFLQQLSAAGISESEGSFTIDFGKAREKLARFQLADPHEFALKLMMAAVDVKARSANLRLSALSGKTAFSIDGWPDELDTESLVKRLCSGATVANNDALDHLAVAINALLGLGCGDILVRHTRADGKQTVLQVDEGVRWDEEEPVAGVPGQLTLMVGERGSLSRSQVQRLLSERCGYAPLTITVNGRPLEATTPQTSGAHRPAFFRSNQLLAQHRYGNFPELSTAAMEGLAARDRSLPSERAAHLRMSVDFDPAATIWLCKSGVLTQMVKLPLYLPGVIGVVAADDLETDLTGMQFLRDDKFEKLHQWLIAAARVMHRDAMEASYRLSAEAQPARLSGPVSELHMCSSCLLAVLGLYFSLKLFDLFNWSTSAMGPLIFLWLLSPLIWNMWRTYRKGCEADVGSHERAREQVRTVLNKCIFPPEHKA